MKKSIKKIILFAAVLFAAGVSQNAAAVGYYIFERNVIDEHHTSTGYPDAATAEAAAVQVCIDSGETEDDCKGFPVRGSFEDIILAYHNNGSRGEGADNAAAVMQMLQNCVDSNPALDLDTCRLLAPESEIMFCGDGTAEDLTDDCDVRSPPPTCGTGTTGTLNAQNECECMDNTHNLITDTATNTQTCEIPTPPNCGPGTTGMPNAQNECECMDNTHNLITDTTTNTQTCEIPDGVPIPNRCPTSGQYDVNVGVNFPGNQACTAITQPAGATNDGENIPGITVVFAGVFNGNRTFAVINNRTDGGGDIDYRNGFGANAILVPIDSRLPTIRLSDISATNGEPTPVGHQNDIEIGTGALSFANHQYYSRPQTVGIAFCTGGQTNDPNDMTMCITPPTCGTGATLNGNVCECTTDALPILLDDGLSCRARMDEDCTGATPDLFNGVCVAACQPDEARNSAGNCVPNPANCGANAITNPDDNTNCVCIDDMHRFVAGSTTACEPIPANPNTPTCEEHQILNSSDECVNRTAENCGNMQVFEPASGGGGVCTSAAMFLSSVSFISPTYTAESCENARWAVSIAINNEKTAAAEVCGIPVVRDDTADDSETAAAAAESVPLQFPENENANGCIIRESADFLTLPDCNDSQLFGNIGFPQMPENFNIANDRLTVAFVADGENQIFFNGENITDSALQPPQPPIINSQTQTAEQDNEALEQFGYIGAGAIAVVAIATFIEGGGFPSFDFSPDFGYRITESGYAANIGGRADFRKDNWHLYYFANQTNNNGEFGDFRYTSGGKYTGDFWAAAFSESVAGETAKYDFSLSADVDGSLIALSPVYRLHSFYDKGKTETRNELNLQGEFRYNSWTIRPAAGFRWENENDFSDSGRFQMNAVYRF